jgi:hypothetical protein
LFHGVRVAREDTAIRAEFTPAPEIKGLPIDVAHTRSRLGGDERACRVIPNLLAIVFLRRKA